MPGYDRTGPEGKGAMTGRGMGKCKDAARRRDTERTENDDLQGRGRGRGFGLFGRGRGRGRGQA